MPSINVYVPDDLKARMDRVADGVNWSSVAQGAFEKALAFFPTMEGSKMSAVLERLKASKAEQVDSVAAAGFAAGRTWAETTADYLTLKRVGEYDWSEDDDEDIGPLFEHVAQVDPETFWANHPKEPQRDGRRGEDFDMAMPPIPPVPPMPPVAAAAAAAATQRIAVRNLRRARAAAARAMRHGHDVARPSSFYIQGFAKGAASVWAEVKNAL